VTKRPQLIERRHLRGVRLAGKLLSPLRGIVMAGIFNTGWTPNKVTFCGWRSVFAAVSLFGRGTLGNLRPLRLRLRRLRLMRRPRRGFGDGAHRCREIDIRRGGREPERGQQKTHGT